MSSESAPHDLIRATKSYAIEDGATTWRLLVFTVLAGLGALALAAAPLGPLSYVGTVLLGLINVRMFIIYHDAMHGAVFRKSQVGLAIMRLYGLLILTPPRVWKDSHNYHHAHTSQIVGSSIGSYPILTVRMYRLANVWQRLAYRATRHWANMLLAYFTVFLFGMCLGPLVRRPARNWSAAVSVALHFGLVYALSSAFGVELALRIYVLPLALSCTLGAYLFYAQHNFPDMEVFDRRSWEYTQAATRSSSYMSGGRFMRWFTGDIGFHHVHHLNSMIPFYRLEEVMRAVPELATPHETKLSLREVIRCLRLHLWDPEAQRMLTYREARERMAARPATPAAA